VRLNPTNSSLHGRDFDLFIKDWFFHPDSKVDIAAIRLDANFLEKQELQHIFFASDTQVFKKDQLKAKGVVAGDGVFVLGFPMNLAGVERNYVIVRQGCIARIIDMLDGTAPTYLLDAFIFPGNSGSPVVLRPELSSITGTSPQAHAGLIGIVNSYRPYIEQATSLQTGHTRVQFEENSGLAEVLPSDYIDQTITSWRIRRKR
jgi:hypothetical protein